MARLHMIKETDIENTYWGISTSVWFNGCVHECKGCWNSDTWTVDESLHMPNDEVIDKVVFSLDEHLPKDLSLLGGDPLAPYNLADLKEILEGVLEQRPHTRILCWTGYKWEFLIRSKLHQDILPLLDILIDGRYVQGLHVEGKIYGSSNQRVIDVKDSLKEDTIVFAPEVYEEEVK